MTHSPATHQAAYAYARRAGTPAKGSAALIAAMRLAYITRPTWGLLVALNDAEEWHRNATAKEARR